MPETEKPTGERIAKLLARAGIASRREVERMIADGRVALDGVVLDTPATILPGLKGVMVDGKPVAAPERTRLFRFHKPAGLLTAERDHTGRPTIYAALRNALPPETPRLMPVGRLDLNTEGLLLMTNDGELKRQLELPSSGVPRTYRARTFGDVTQAQLEELIEGVTVDGVRYGRIDANLERSAGRNRWIELTLSEGKNREVRRVLEHLGLQVSRLIRTSYGRLELGDLPRGAAQEVRREELERFRSSLRQGPARDREGESRPRPQRTAEKRPEHAVDARPLRAGRTPSGKPPLRAKDGALADRRPSLANRSERRSDARFEQSGPGRDGQTHARRDGDGPIRPKAAGFKPDRTGAKRTGEHRARQERGDRGRADRDRRTRDDTDSGKAFGRDDSRRSGPAAKPASDAPRQDRAGMAKTDAERGRPEGAKPGRSKPGASTPRTPRRGRTAPDGSRPDGARPGGSGPRGRPPRTPRGGSR